MNYITKPIAFQAMAKPIGPICNLNCTYCYYLEKYKLYKDCNNFKMPDELLAKFVKQYIMAQEVPVVQFVWQGGEPTLLGIEYFEKIIQLQKKYALGKKIENSLQTNGTLLSDEWCVFLKKNNFLVGISVDGPEQIHDKYRPLKTGKPSFEKVMRGINLLRKHQIDFNTLTVVHNHNSKYPLEIYKFLKSIGSTYLQFIPIVERASSQPSANELKLVGPYDTSAQVTDWSVKPVDYGNFLISIFNEWVRNDVGSVFVQQFDATLANWVGENPGICVFTPTCGDAVVIEHNGDVYSCDHFVYPQYKLGNIQEESLLDLVQSEKQKKFGKIKQNTLPRQCIECDYAFACHGECPKHRFTKTSDGENNLNYLCAGYKKFYSHVHPYMQFMEEELEAKRAPANVMAWARNIR